MTQSAFTYTYGTGRLRGIKHEIGVRHDPDVNDVESFAAVLFFTMRDGRRVEIAKVDDSEHDDANADVHIDRYYREVGADVKDFDPDADIENWVDAEDYLRENWKWFARTYLQNHGEGPRADGANVGAD